MTIDQASVAAGWYRDPAGSQALRWWDGTQWTTHLQQPAPPVAPAAPAYQAPVQQQAPVQPEVNLGAYRPGSGFGTAAQQPQQQNAWGMNPYGTAAPARIGRISNRIAWISFVAGLLAITAIFILLLFPGNYWLPFFGLLAILTGVRALARRGRGTVTVLWPQVLGVSLGVLAEGIMIIGVFTGLFTLNGYSPVASPQGVSTNAPFAPTSPVAIGPTGTMTIYEVGVDSPTYLPPSNGTLSSVVKAEQTIVQDMQTANANRGGPAADGEWPKALEQNAAGDVRTSSGTDFGNLLQPGWHLGYQVESDGSFVLGITASNTSEMALYASKSEEFAVVCEASDQTCTTDSPVKPITANSTTGAVS